MNSAGDEMRNIYILNMYTYIEKIIKGWTSTGDPLSNVGIPFPTKEAAVEYAERNGYGFNVIEPEQEVANVRNIAPFQRAMVHHWRHQVPVYEEDEPSK